MTIFEQINAPDADYAYREACRLMNNSRLAKDWSHPAVKFAAVQSGYDNLNIKSKICADAFEKIYLDACKRYGAGDLLTIANPEAKVIKEKYVFVREGVLKQYEHVSSCDEAIAIIDKLIGTTDNKLRRFINNLERKYRMQGQL